MMQRRDRRAVVTPTRTDASRSAFLVAVALSLVLFGEACVRKSFNRCEGPSPDPDCFAGDGGLCGTCPSERPVCSPTTKQCVGCFDNTHCTDPLKSRCDSATHSCVACAGPGDCAHVENRPLCDEGVCGQCTATDQSACAGKACAVATRTCSGFDTGTQGACMPCDTDANCASSHACVAMTYQGEPRANGYCLKRGDAPGGCVQPFAIPISRTSIDGAAAADYCGILEQLTTCEAVRGLTDTRACAGGFDSECPQPGGICRKVGLTANQCTYRCSDSAQCKTHPNPGSTCGPPESTPDAERYCGGKM